MLRELRTNKRVRIIVRRVRELVFSAVGVKWSIGSEIREIWRKNNEIRKIIKWCWVIELGRKNLVIGKIIIKCWIRKW